MILARAGLERLGLGDRITEVLGAAPHHPAVSQGIVALTCREDDPKTRDLLAAATHQPTLRLARLERAFLSTLGGGCNVPAGVCSREEDGQLVLEARVLGVTGAPCLEEVGRGPATEPEALGIAVAESLLEQGADRLLKELRA